MKKVTYTKVDEFFESLTLEECERYKAYWRTLTPEDYLETFERWLFAFCSVHTTWKLNVKGFEAIRPWLKWSQDSAELKNRLTASGVGLQTNRTRYIGQFCDRYWKAPWDYYKKDSETWVSYRNRLVENILGLGMAKVSFGIEMIYPCASEVACLDTHLFKFYGLDQTKHAKQYESIEAHWIDNCKKHQIPSSTIARAIYWDHQQGQPNSRYWTYVLEKGAQVQT